MKQKLCALLLITALLFALTLGASAKQVDLSPVEANRDIGVVAANYPEVGSELEPDTALPAVFSSRELSTPVRKQRFNTCWAYASTAVLEIAARKAGIYNDYFSPMHMNYWSTMQSDGSGWQRGYTAAGYPYIAMGYMTSGCGAVTEADFPYTSEMSDYQEFGKDLSPYLSVTSMIFLNANDRDTVKTAIYKYGAAVGNFHNTSEYYSSGNTAYYCDLQGLTTRQLAGHAVTVVGWDDNYSRENFNENHRPKNNGAWLCKNSWGESWSPTGGYFYISYEDNYLFDERFGPSFAINGLVQYDSGDKIYQNEKYGLTTEFEYISSATSSLVRKNKKLTYVNVFDFDDGYLDLDRIMFETYSEGADYDLWYIPVDSSGVPTDDETRWQPLGSGTVEYQGYHSIDIDNITVPRGKGGIGVTLKMTDKCSAVTIGSCEWLQIDYKDVFIPGSKRGDSYVIGYSEKPDDVMDLFKKWFDDDNGGTFVIKAVTERLGIMGDVDLDGDLTILDVTSIQRKIADLDHFDEYQDKLADYDGDGEVTIIDCTKIQRVLAGIDPSPYETES